MTQAAAQPVQNGAPQAGTPAHAEPPVPVAPGDPERGPSVLILTKNEAANIEDCLHALAWCDDIVILDSLSTDRTVELACRFPNVRVFSRPFDTEWKQRNFGLHGIAYRHPWVYICDADEIVTPELRAELLRTTTDAQHPTPHSAFRLRYKNMFFGRWIKRSSSYPVWLIRLVRPAKVRYEIRQTNVHPIVDGTVGSLQEHFEHYSFRSGLKRWFQKHNFYSTREAMEAMKVRQKGLPRVRDLLAKDPMVRRRTAKNLSFFLRFRGIARWLRDCILGRAFLDGMAGLRYISLMAVYEYWLEVKITEQRQDWQKRNDWVVRHRLARRGDRQPPPPLTEPGTGRPLIETMIPTFNEAAHIAETVRNALQLGPVFVLDSLSTDGTQELARRAGATVVEHPFENYSRQKNWGLDHLPFKGDWIFILDADERLTPELVDEVNRVVRSGRAADAYFVNRVVVMMGRCVWHGGMFPSWNLRFFRRGTCRYEDRSVHEHMVFEGRPDYLHELMLHIRRESINDYLDKHIKYADMESDEWVKQKTGAVQRASAGRLFKDLLRFRIYLRRDVWPSVPLQPFVRFVYMYICRLGFLDGAAGWHLANLMGTYEYMIKLMYLEKLERQRAQARKARAPAGAPPVQAG